MKNHLGRVFPFHILQNVLIETQARNQGEGEDSSPALNKEKKLVPEFSLKDYEILRNEH